jgi:mannose-6-phosphate isomerase-like protein (cupin superfamily)
LGAGGIQGRTLHAALEAWQKAAGSDEVKRVLSAARGGSLEDARLVEAKLGVGIRHLPEGIFRSAVELEAPLLSEKKRQTIMGSDQRVDQRGDGRPPSQMTRGPGVARFQDAPAHILAKGVTLKRVLDDSTDPAVSVDGLSLEPGRQSPQATLPSDLRALAIDDGAVRLQGKRQDFRAGDVVLVPRGTPFAFEASKDRPLQLWAVSTPSWSSTTGGFEGAVARKVEQDVPMAMAAGIQRFDPAKEFFVGEGLFILERPGSEADPALGFDRATCPPGITTALHQLSIDERYLITRGTGVADVGGKKVAVSPGDVVVYPRSAPQRITAGNKALEFYCINTPRFVVADYLAHLENGSVDAALYDGSAGPLEAVARKLSGEVPSSD